jgi:glucokinase
VAPRGGIDLGGTKIEAVVVDADAKVLGQARRPTPIQGGPADVAAELAAALRSAAEDAGVRVSDLAGVGVGSPGGVDTEAGTVSGAANLPGWAGTFALGPELSRELHLPVRLGNDVSVATRAEFELGAGRDYRSLLGVFWGTGVGGGIVLDGRLWEGRGAAGEIGHIVIRRGGSRCPCGRRGCLEAYAGRVALEARARREAERGTRTKLFSIMKQRQRTRLTSSVWARALDEDDRLAAKLLDRAVEALGAGIASAVNLLDVEAVILGGGLGVRLGARYLRPLEERTRGHLFVSDRPPDLRLAQLGDLGGALGAALLVA